jgi:hypothetical protein
MPKALTESSSVSCDHPPAGGGAVTVSAGQSVLKVGGKAVLAKSQSGASINPANCLQQTPPVSNKPCSTVLSQTAQNSTVLKVNGTFVLLEGTSGTTDGQPDNKWSAKDAGQDVLKAS